MNTRTGTFIKGGKRLVAYELARSGDAGAWNAWRQESDIFGDHQRSRVNLSVTDLSDRRFIGYNLANVSLYRSNLSRSDLEGVDLAYADLHECRLIEANLTRANLRYARLSRAYLRGAVLDYADLRGADLRRASLTSASLAGCDLRGVDLSSTRGLDQLQLDDAVGDGRTRLPHHLYAPASWDIYEGDRHNDDEGIEDLRIIPASVEVAVIGGIVQLAQQPGDAHFASTADPVALRKEILADIEQLMPRWGNVPELVRAVSRYVDELKKDDGDIIMIGVRGLKMQTIFAAVTGTNDADAPEMLPDAVGSMRAILLQHFLFISQSHKWKAFLEEAALSPYSTDDREAAKQSSSEVASVLDDHLEACDIHVPRAIEIVAEEVDIHDDAQRLAVFNAFASVENLFRSLITWIVREAKRFLGEAWTSFRENLAKVVGTSMAALVVALFTSKVAVALATTYPERFAWLAQAIEMLKPTT